MRLRVRRSAEPLAAPHGSGADDRGRSSSSSPAGGVSVAKGIVALVLGREVDAEYLLLLRRLDRQLRINHRVQHV
jgi:hypothetical protein